MTSTKMKRILTGIGITKFENAQTPEIKTICMSTNQGINPHRDFMTFDFDNELIKIKQRQLKIAENGDYIYTAYTTNKYDIYLDMNQVLGFELNSARVGNS